MMYNNTMLFTKGAGTSGQEKPFPVAIKVGLEQQQLFLLRQLSRIMPSNKESPMLYMQGKLARQLFRPVKLRVLYSPAHLIILLPL